MQESCVGLACSWEGAKRGVQTPAARAVRRRQGAPLLSTLQLGPCQGAMLAPSQRKSTARNSAMRG